MSRGKTASALPLDLLTINVSAARLQFLTEKGGKTIRQTRADHSWPGAEPDAVEDGAVLEDPQQLVIRGDVVEVGSLLIGEEQVWLPY